MIKNKFSAWIIPAAALATVACATAVADQDLAGADETISKDKDVIAECDTQVLRWGGNSVAHFDGEHLREMLSDLEDLDLDMDFEFSTETDGARVFAFRFDDLEDQMARLHDELADLHQNIEVIDGDGNREVIIKRKHKHAEDVHIIEEGGVKIITTKDGDESKVTITEDESADAKIITVEGADGKRTVITITED